MSTKLQNETALVIDANALIHRAWHALPPLSAPDGRLVNAVYGFASVLLKILASERPTYLVVCWDTPETTFRHEANKEYKAQRESQPDEFYAQIPWTQEVVTVLGGTNVELPGYEADDLLGTYAALAAKKHIQVTLLTSDRDAYQLIGPLVRVMAFKKGVSDTVIYDEKMLKEVTGLTPEQIPDYKALRGDASDNLKGVSGIGEKTATDLIQTYKNLDGVLKAAKDTKSALSPSVRQKLIAGEQIARETLPIVRIVCDAPIPILLEQTRRRPVQEDELSRVFLEFGFKTLLARALGKNSPLSPMTKREGAVGASPIHQRELEGVIPVVDFDAFIAHVRSEKFLIIHPLEILQNNLFAVTPSLALGTATQTLILSTDQLKDANVIDELKQILAATELKKIGHNLKHCWHWAKRHGFELRGLEFDTELAAYLLSAGDRAYELRTLAMARLGLTIPDTDERPVVEIEAIRGLRGFFVKELKEQRLVDILERFEMPLVPVLAQMEAYGILIDRKHFKQVEGDFRITKAQLEKDMTELVGQSFNPASPQQLAHVLFEVLKIPTKGIKRGKTGFSTAAPELEKLEGVHPLIEKIGQYREVAKLLSTYVETLPALADAEGRVHTTYNQALAATGRLSSSDPNLQNIPARTELGRKIRRGFIAAPGYRLLSCDYSQIELRVIAALSKDEQMLDAFYKGLDIHTATAAAIWKVPLESVTPDQRRAAKTINFGIIYGQGPQALSKGAGISFEEAKRFIAEYFQVYFGVKAYLDGTKALAHAQGYVETLFGRRRPVPDINSPLPQLRAAAERMAINMPVQGTATADIMKLAMIEVARRLSSISAGTRLLLQVHDELVFEVPEDEIEHVMPQLVEIMQTVAKIGVPLIVDAKEGKNWDEMKKVATTQ